MPRETNTEKIDKLSNLVATLTFQLEALREQVNGIDVEQDRTADTLTELKTQLALLSQQVNEMKKVKEEWGRRLWAIVGPILGALIGGVIGYFLRR